MRFRLHLFFVLGAAVKGELCVKFSSNPFSGLSEGRPVFSYQRCQNRTAQLHQKRCQLHCSRVLPSAEVNPEQRPSPQPYLRAV